MCSSDLEMAINASIGVAVVILTNLLLLAVASSFLNFDPGFQARLVRRANYLLPFWRRLAGLTRFAPARAVIAASLVLLGVGLWQATDVRIGDQQRGIPELRSSARYNLDTVLIAEKFSIGVDLLTVFAETTSQACIDYEIMDRIDQFSQHMQSTAGVQSVISLPMVAKIINAGWNEGNMKWRVLSRNPSVLTQSVSYVPTSSGLLNSDCSVMPVLIFSADHKAGTINTIIDSVRDFSRQHESPQLRFRLASGNVGVMEIGRAHV